MTTDLVHLSIIVISVIGIVLELVFATYLVILVRESRTKIDADDAALYLQSRRVQEVLREMRAEFLRQ